MTYFACVKACNGHSLINIRLMFEARQHNLSGTLQEKIALGRRDCVNFEVEKRREMWVPVFIFESVVFSRRLHDNEEATRMREVMTSIEETGTYELTEQELAFGAKLAWRNASRCIGRKQWQNLKVKLFC